MKKYGYNRIVLSSGKVVPGPVVITVDEHLRMVEYHALYGEEPMVEWVGGTYTESR